METSWKKIILRFCIIVIIIFSASYVVGEYREYKEQQEIGTQLEREEVSTEVRNEVLTGKAGVKDKLLGYEDVNLTRLYIYVHAYNQMVEEKAIPERGAEKVLKLLFDFSVVGNDPSIKHQAIFKYERDSARFNFKENIIVHRGLYKALQIF